MPLNRRDILALVFSERLLEHFRQPRNAGELPGATATAQVTNPVCGDVLRLSLRIEGQRIAAARFKAQGCVAAIAAASALTEMLLGKTATEARAITVEQIASELGGLPQASYHAAQLALDALRSVLGAVR